MDPDSAFHQASAEGSRASAWDPSIRDNARMRDDAGDLSSAAAFASPARALAETPWAPPQAAADHGCRHRGCCLVPVGVDRGHAAPVLAARRNGRPPQTRLSGQSSPPSRAVLARALGHRRLPARGDRRLFPTWHVSRASPSTPPGCSRRPPSGQCSPRHVSGSTTSPPARSTFYAAQAGAFDDIALERALLLTEHAAVAIAAELSEDRADNLGGGPR